MSVVRTQIPRSVAVRVLTRVLSDSKTLQEAVEELGPHPWIQEVCSGTLRLKPRLDLAIDSIALKKKPTGWLRKVLLIAAYQILEQDPGLGPRVVDETVTLIKKQEGNPPAQFANACLRKLVEQADHWKGLEYHSEWNDEQSATWACLPVWLWKKLKDQHGLQWAQSFAEASLARPDLWVRTRPGVHLDWAEPGPIPGSFKSQLKGPIRQFPGFEKGEWMIQDISSQWIIHQVGQVLGLSEKSSESKFLKGLDVCASPGGKAIGLAWSGAQMVATDYDSRRISVLRENIQRTQLKIDVVPWENIDAFVPPADFVWIDAPCSSTGIIRRHPDIRWLRKEAEIRGLAQTQKELVNRFWRAIRPGGFLIYSVCSILKEEGPEILEEAGISLYLRQSWFLSPQEPLGGEGFQAFLLQKPTA